MSKGSFLAIFSANSILRLRSLDMSPTTGSNYNELSKNKQKIPEQTPRKDKYQFQIRPRGFLRYRKRPQFQQLSERLGTRVDSDGKTSNKKRTTRFATLLQNELNSHVASFTKHEKKFAPFFVTRQVRTWVVRVQDTLLTHESHNTQRYGKHTNLQLMRQKLLRSA